MVDVSVVIPCHEMWGTVKAAAQSALLAGASEVFVVDDGSYLGADAPFKMLGPSPVRFHFTISRGGVCYTRNIGIQKTAHNLIVPLDADDELLPDGLQALVDAWQPGTLVYGGWMEGDEYKSPAPPEMLNRKNVAHATWLFHKDDWRRVGGYDPDFNIGGEDWAFMVALVAAGVQAVRIDTPIYRKAVREGSRTDQARSRFPFIKQLLREKYPAVMG